MSRFSKALARVLAVLALAGVLVALVLVISSSLGDDGGGGGRDEQPAARNQEDRRGQGDRRPEREPRVYVVQPGDSLSVIADKTGVSLEELQRLNPEIDPQILQSGARLRLR